MTAASRTEELVYRESEGFQVSLLWSRLTDRVTVLVADIRTGELLDLTPPRDRALDAFYHPFAYAPRPLPA